MTIELELSRPPHHVTIEGSLYVGQDRGYWHDGAFYNDDPSEFDIAGMVPAVQLTAREEGELLRTAIAQANEEPEHDHRKYEDI